jgi:L-aminopeptidase/D-esterase-like protein
MISKGLLLLSVAILVLSHPLPNTIHDSILYVPGIAAANSHIKVGPYSGVTIILCPEKCTASVIQLGGSPCTSQTDSLKIENFGVKQVSAITLSGGSMYGLYGSSMGAYQCIIESDSRIKKQNVFDIDLPHVSSASLLDFGIHIHNQSNTQYQSILLEEYKHASIVACKYAIGNYFEGKRELRQGNTGAGTGAAVGQILFDTKRMMKGGLGSAAYHITDGIFVGAVIAVNVLGEVKLEDGTTIAGLLQQNRSDIMPYDEILSSSQFVKRTLNSYASTTNTAIGTIVTNLKLNKAELRKVTEMAMQGLSDAVYPSSSMYDGDTLFGLSTEELKREDVYGSEEIDIITSIGTFARKALAKAVRRAVCCAKDSNGLKSVLDKKLCSGIYEEFQDKSNCDTLSSVSMDLTGNIDLN